MGEGGLGLACWFALRATAFSLLRAARTLCACGRAVVVPVLLLCAVTRRARIPAAPGGSGYPLTIVSAFLARRDKVLVTLAASTHGNAGSSSSANRPYADSCPARAALRGHLGEVPHDLFDSQRFG